MTTNVVFIQVLELADYNSTERWGLALSNPLTECRRVSNRVPFASPDVGPSVRSRKRVHGKALTEPGALEQVGHESGQGRMFHI